MNENEAKAREMVETAIERTQYNAIVVVNMTRQQLWENKQNICNVLIECKEIMDMLYEKYKNEYEMVEKLNRMAEQLESEGKKQ